MDHTLLPAFLLLILQYQGGRDLYFSDVFLVESFVFQSESVYVATLVVASFSCLLRPGAPGANLEIFRCKKEKESCGTLCCTVQKTVKSQNIHETGQEAGRNLEWSPVSASLTNCRFSLVDSSSTGSRENGSKRMYLGWVGRQEEAWSSFLIQLPSPTAASLSYLAFSSITNIPKVLGISSRLPNHTGSGKTVHWRQYLELMEEYG